jgi:hypothetical protein
MERRVGPATLLEVEGTQQRFPASGLPQLGLYAQGHGPYQPYGAHPSSYRPYAPSSGNATEVILAWVFGALGLFCCPVFPLIGVVLAFGALGKRQPTAGWALLFCILVLVVSIAGLRSSADASYSLISSCR